MELDVGIKKDTQLQFIYCELYDFKISHKVLTRGMDPTGLEMQIKWVVPSLEEQDARSGLNNGSHPTLSMPMRILDQV
jgi:hypothetical protein